MPKRPDLLKNGCALRFEFEEISLEIILYIFSNEINQTATTVKLFYYLWQFDYFGDLTIRSYRLMIHGPKHFETEKSSAEFPLRLCESTCKLLTFFFFLSIYMYMYTYMVRKRVTNGSNLISGRCTIGSERT